MVNPKFPIPVLPYSLVRSDKIIATAGTSKEIYLLAREYATPARKVKIYLYDRFLGEVTRSNKKQSRKNQKSPYVYTFIGSDGVIGRITPSGTITKNIIVPQSRKNVYKISPSCLTFLPGDITLYKTLLKAINLCEKYHSTIWVIYYNDYRYGQLRINPREKTAQWVLTDKTHPLRHPSTRIDYYTGRPI